MATVMDIGLLQSFSDIFLVLFVWVVVYAILQKVKVLGENKGLNAIVAISVAIFLAFSAKPKIIVKGIIPWFVLLFVFFMFLVMGMRFTFGVDAGDEMLLKVLGGEQSAGWWIFIGAAAILLVVVSSLVGPEVTPGSNQTAPPEITTPGQNGDVDTGDWRTNVLNTLYHPKVLGSVLLLVIALFAIQFLTRTPA